MDFLITYGPRFLNGLVLSLELTVISVVLGYALGLVLAFMVISRNPLLRWPALLIVEIGRGAPVLVLLYMVYYGLPSLDLLFDNLTSAIIALTWSAAAYSSESIRAGIQSVPSGQQEAADALGMSRTSTMTRIIIPQGMRSAIPALMGLAIQMFQATALAYSISVNELMSQAYQIGIITFEYLKTFAVAGLIYAAISVPVTWLTVRAEHRLNRRFA